MRKLTLVLFACLFAVPLRAQIDTSKWLTLDNLTNNLGDCLFATQDTVSGGFLSLTANSGSFSCAGLSSATREAGFIASKSFSFTYGVVKARIRFGSPGNHIYSALWMWGGGATSLGYPPTCIAAMQQLPSNPAGVMAMCTNGSSVPAYEVDIAESSTSTNINQAYLSWVNGTNTATSKSVTVYPAEDAYHIYELDWYPSILVFRIDGLITNTISISLAAPMFLQMDQEPGRAAPTSYPAVTSVDWIRVCSDPNAYCNPGDSTMIFDDEFNEGVVTTPANHTIQGQTVQGGAIQ